MQCKIMRRGPALAPCRSVRNVPRLSCRRRVHVRVGGRKQLVVAAELVNKGRMRRAQDITVKTIIGEGSFGQVFDGLLSTSLGDERVVLKRVKPKVQGAEQMSMMEHLLNVYASKAAKGYCAEFLGYCEVTDEEATSRLTPGLWLMWRYEGNRTLAYYLRRRDCIRALSDDLGVPEEAVVPTVMKQLLQGLQAFHNAGLVHRDIKPLNMVLSEEDRRFKLIDLGACADLRSGTNYVPDESILDPNYCPPEQFVLPTDAPHLSKRGALAAVMSPVLWAMHKPDRFDSWSAGVTLLQLGLPSLRSDRALRNFNTAFERAGYDLEAWREAANLPARETALLDADDGAGWELAANLLRPRAIEVDESGGVAFVNTGAKPRLSAGEALKHRFFNLAMAATMDTDMDSDVEGTGIMSSSTTTGSTISGSTRSQGAFAAAAAAWRGVTGRLFSQEAKLLRQASATQQQTSNVKRLRDMVSAGAATAEQLSREERRLARMKERVASIEQEVQASSKEASGMINFLGFKSNSGKQRAPAMASESAGVTARAPRILRSGGGSTGTTGSTKSGAWRQLANKLMGLEARLTNQAQATERQVANVLRLQSQVNIGRASPNALERQQQVLAKMQRRLAEMRDDYARTKSEATGILPVSSQSRNSGSQYGSAAADRAAAAAEAADAVMTMDEPLAAPPQGAVAKFMSRLTNQEAQTAKKAEMVRQMREKVAAGEAEERLLQREEALLTKMQRKLGELQQGVGSGVASAGQALASMAGMPAPAAAQDRMLPDTDGGMRSRSWWSGSGRRQVSSPPPPAVARMPVAEPVEEAAPQGAVARFMSRLTNQQAQTLKKEEMVKQIREKVAAGEAEERLLQREEALLTKMQRKLGELQSGAGQAFATMTGASAPVPPPAPPTPRALPAPADNMMPETDGGMRSRSWWAGGSRAPRRSERLEQVEAEVIEASPTQRKPQPMAQPAGQGNFLFQGLRFAGLAVKVTGDLANSFKNDTERVLKEMDEAANAKRAARAADGAFLEMLRERDPPVTSRTPWGELMAEFRSDDRWDAVESDDRRRELFSTYAAAAKKQEDALRAQAEVTLKKLYRRLGVEGDTSWTEVQAAAAFEPDFLAVPDESIRRQVFVAYRQDRQLKSALKDAARNTDKDFRRLLREQTSPPITADSKWPIVKPQLWSDPRYVALPEKRRRQLFEDFVGALQAQETLQEAAASAAAAVATASAVVSATSSETPGGAPATADQLEYMRMLKAQQEKMKADYEAMEAKLRAMEARLATSPSPAPASMSSADEDGINNLVGVASASSNGRADNAMAPFGRGGDGSQN